MGKRRPFQFSLGWLIGWSTALAICLAAVGWLTSSPLLQAVAGAYFAFLVMRWPVVRAIFQEVRRRRQVILQQRKEMVAEALQKKPLPGLSTGPSDQTDH